MDQGKESSVLAEVAWEGDSRKVLQGFPDAIKADLGFGLFQLQQGELPLRARRLESVGPGVWELKESDERTWYRMVYVTKIAGRIYVLHCFEKKSRKTDGRDLETAKRRLSVVRARIEKEKSK